MMRKKQRILTEKERMTAYNIAEIDENEAEINMYGDVVEERPVDFWTGEPMAGNYIALNDFMADLEGLSTKSKVTVHLNSCGGSLYAAAAIHNRLKSMDAEVTTVNDSLAASAASLIFMAGDTRKMHKGSNLMIHGAASFLFGPYNAQALEAEQNMLKAHNQVAAAIYAARTGKTEKEILKIMKGEKWLTGEEAVEEGFADEIIGETSVEMRLTEDETCVVAGGVKFPVAAMLSLPPGIVKSGFMPASWLPEKNRPEQKKEEEPMITNVTELRQNYPRLVAEIEAAAKQEGAEEERGRIQGIEAIEGSIADKKVVQKAKYEEPTTAEALAFSVMQMQGTIGAAMLADMKKDEEESGSEDVKPDPKKGDGEEDEEKKKKEVQNYANVLNMDRKGVC